MKFWIGMNPQNQPLRWFVTIKRSDCIQEMTEGLMGASDYDRLGSRSARWAFLYRQGYRVVPATLTVDHLEVVHEHR